MFKRLLVGGLAFSFIVTPLFVSADQQADLQATVNLLQAELSAMKAQPTSSVTHGSACPVLTRNLSRGAQGEDVKQLQQFLIAEGMFAADSATGFFGAFIEGAVQKWQAKSGIVSSGTPATTGFGVVGARTRATIAMKCVTQPGSSNVQLQVKKVPSTFVWTNGSPLTLEYTISGPNVSRFGVCVELEDELGRPLLTEAASDCDTPRTVTRSDVIYVNRIFAIAESDLTNVGKDLLSKITAGVRINFKVLVLDAEQVRSKGSYRDVNVIVEDSTGIFTAKIPYEIRQAAGRNIQRVDDVGALAKALTSYAKDHGQHPAKLDALVTEKYLPLLPKDPLSGSPYTYATRTNGKEYVLQVVMEIDADKQVIGPREPLYFFHGSFPMDGITLDCPTGTATFCIWDVVDDTSPASTSLGKMPVIQSFSGPTTIKEDQEGTWTVVASDPDNEQLSYAIYFGDELQSYTPSKNQSATPQSRNTTYSHSYAYPKPGTYTITVYVYDSSGNRTQATSTVQVNAR